MYKYNKVGFLDGIISRIVELYSIIISRKKSGRNTIIDLRIYKLQKDQLVPS